MVGKVEALLDNGINVDDPVFTRPFTRMQQHVLDNGIRTLAVLHDLLQIALQRIRNLADLHSQPAIEVGTSKRLPQFINQFDRDAGKIVDEIERVLDLVRDTGGKLTKGSELLRLDETVLCGSQVFERLR